jgi:hypothetical protein
MGFVTGQDVFFDDVDGQQTVFVGRVGEDGLPEKGASVFVEPGCSKMEVFAPCLFGPQELNRYKSIIGYQIMAIEPPEFGVEQVEVILRHSERFRELFTEQGIFFVESLFKEHFSVSVGYRILQGLNFTAVFYIDLHENMPTALGRHVVRQDQRFHQMEIQI